MQLIQDLISELRKGDFHIENALIQAQVLAHKLGDQEMGSWVDAELNGYANPDAVPPYRVMKLSIVGVVTNGRWIHRGQSIALVSLDPEFRKELTTRNITEGVGAIQEWSAREADDKHLGVRIAPEICALLSRAYSAGSYVQNARGVPSVGAFRQILTQVRSRLLTFALKLQDQVPEAATDEDIRERLGADAVNEIFRGAVFGDNATIIVGDRNAVRGITNSIVHQDFPSLTTALQKLGLQEVDIQELQRAIEADETAPEHAKQGFGGRVRGWLGDMVSKAGTKVWETAAGAGTTALIAALKAYYGWS